MSLTPAQEKAALAIAGDDGPFLELLLTDPSRLCHPMALPCRPWRHGLSKGRPIMRAPKPGHPVAHYFGPPHSVRRICAQTRCVNPAHYIGNPRLPTGPQHPLVYEAELEVNPLTPLIENLSRIQIPPHYVLQAYRNLRSINLVRA